MPPAMGGGGYAAHQPAPPTAAHIGSDPFVRVLAEAVVGSNGDAATIGVYLEPTTGTLANLAVQLECPPSLRISLSAAPPASIAGPRVTLPMLSPGGASLISLSITCAPTLATVPETQILGQLAYSDAAGGEQRVLGFRVPLGLHSLLRPNPIATPEFGGLWGMHAAEAKNMVACACGADASAFMGMLSRLNIAPVQTIGVECIASGKLAGTSTILLVHGKLGLMNGRALELTLRTKDPRLSDAVLRLVGELLQAGA